MKLAEYNPGTIISGAPDKIVTNTAPEYPPLLTKQVGNIVSFELGNKNSNSFIWGHETPAPSYSEGPLDTVEYIANKATPYFLCVSETEIEANNTYQKVIQLTGASVSNWETTLFIDGGTLEFSGLAYSEDGVTFYDNFDFYSAVTTNVTTSYMEFTVKYKSNTNRDSFWDKLTVGVNKGLLYLPEYVAIYTPPVDIS